MQRARVRLDQTVLDWTVALALAVWAQVDQWLAGHTLTRVHGSPATVVPFLLLVTLPLAVRRRWPLGVLCVVMGAIALDSAIVGKAAQGADLLFPMLIVLYTVAAHCDLRRALVGLAIAGACYSVEASLDPEVVTVGDLVVVEASFFVALGGACWLAGRYVRARRTDAQRSEDRAARAENEQERRAQLAVSHERDRIARELHDVIAHSVSLMGVQAGAAERVLERDPERAREALRSIQATARESIGELRRLLGVLRSDSVPADLAPQPGLRTLASLADEHTNAGFVVELTLEGAGRHVPAGVELSAYRIVQEALTNVRKHAPGAAAQVQVSCGARQLELRIDSDAGHPTGAAPPGTGSGILGMRERVALYGGSLDARPRADGGFRVHARLPIEATS